MKNLKAIILEDDISSAWEFEMLLEELGVNETQVFKSWQGALPLIKDELVDFMIIDLYLAQNESGFDHIQLLNELSIPFVICTGFPKEKFLDKALDKGAKGFFTKPFDRAALTFSLKNILKEIKSAKPSDETLFIKASRKLIKVYQRDILYIEVEGNYITIKMRNNKRIAIKESLVSFEKKLIEKLFVRSHRTTLVNVNEIEQLDMKNNQLLLLNKETLPLGDKYSAVIKDRFIRNN